VAVSHDGTSINVLSTATLEVLSSLPGGARPVAFTDEDHALLALSPHGQLQRWRFDLPVSAPEEIVLFGDDSASRVALSADERWLAATDTTGRIQVWDWPARQRLFQEQAHQSLACGLAFSPDGESLVSVGGDRSAKLWHTRTGHLRAAWTAKNDPLNVCFSPHDSTVAIGLDRGMVELHALGSSVPHRTLHTSNAHSTSLAFSPDGSRLVCGGPNGLLQVYSTDDWREVTTLTAGGVRDPGNEAVVSLQFSSDSRVLAACLADGRLRVWRQ
jgi:WD40 repeat protein